MGKPTGFLEYRRAENPCSAPKDRVSDYSDFHFSLPEDQRREQGARCMNCGVPFCQSAFGCPLHNLVPEWNDEIYSGNWSHALSRLTKTNPFPEFTGRVCPALCEHACICGMDDPSAAVTIRENELAVSDYAWAHHFIEPSIPAIRTDKQVAVIGSGPAGLAAADLLNQRGHHVTIYEKDELPGGLLMFGIPAMKLEKSIILRRTEKMQKEGIIFNCNTEIGRDLPAAQLLKQYDAVLLACGARQERTVANAGTGIPGVLSALDFLSENTRALLEGRESSKNAKGLDVLVIGNGDTATDCVATAIRQGAKSIRQLVRKPPKNGERVWPYRPSGEKTAYGQEEAAALFGQDPRMYETSIQKLLVDEAGALCSAVVLQGESEITLPAGLLILAAGFSGAEEKTAKAFHLREDGKGHIGKADYTTENPSVFACGDIRRGPSLVVWAIAEGRACAKAVDRYLEGYTNL